MKIKVPNTSLEFNVKKGNHKPIPPFVYIGSMQSSTKCICRTELDCCEIGEDCYALGYESNPLMYKTVECRERDEECIDYLVQNRMHRFFANELIKRSNNARKHKMKFFRWNESGDMKTLDHFLFVDEVADILYKELGVISVIYTHRKDLWDQFKNIRKSQALIVNGSGFMADNNFVAVEEFTDGNEHCNSNCVNCFKDEGYYCYNPRKLGSVIEEIYRRKKTKKE